MSPTVSSTPRGSKAPFNEDKVMVVSYGDPRHLLENQPIPSKQQNYLRPGSGVPAPATQSWPADGAPPAAPSDGINPLQMVKPPEFDRFGNQIANSGVVELNGQNYALQKKKAQTTQAEGVRVNFDVVERPETAPELQAEESTLSVRSESAAGVQRKKRMTRWGAERPLRRNSLVKLEMQELTEVKTKGPASVSGGEKSANKAKKGRPASANLSMYTTAAFTVPQAPPGSLTQFRKPITRACCGPNRPHSAHAGHQAHCTHQLNTNPLSQPSGNGSKSGTPAKGSSQMTHTPRSEAGASATRTPRGYNTPRSMTHRTEDGTQYHHDGIRKVTAEERLASQIKQSCVIPSAKNNNLRARRNSGVFGGAPNNLEKTPTVQERMTLQQARLQKKSFHEQNKPRQPVRRPSTGGISDGQSSASSSRRPSYSVGVDIDYRIDSNVSTIPIPTLLFTGK